MLLLHYFANRLISFEIAFFIIVIEKSKGENRIRTGAILLRLAADEGEDKKIAPFTQYKYIFENAKNQYGLPRLY